MVRIGFIGAGKMAQALASGLVKQGKTLKNPGHMMASCPVQDKYLLEPFKDLGMFPHKLLILSDLFRSILFLVKIFFNLGYYIIST